ncbi:sulfotransferase family protein [Shimia haliotis]|uniref:Sulfotransferase domain-containing protein n=1 Tax=Shimia haliotis TaxID=1280847 RepID=A0A1I4ELI7_9RHOB|nr:sulfotransferase [Shimia haliotis]SFL05316.1 Sulfotransferase domain-containing protein [Shimia haliotis]
MTVAPPKVNFVVAGAQKSGTRALAHFLRQHPDIGLSIERLPEPHYFDKRYRHKDPPQYDAYHALFDAQDLSRVTGDVTPIYIFHPPSIERIKAYNPDMKVIVLLRDPVARAHSHWAMEHERGDEPRSFAFALLNEVRMYLMGKRRHRVISYLQRGFYAGQIAHLYDHFPKHQCLILRSDDLRKNHAKTLHLVHEFLEVPTADLPTPKTVHSRDYAPLPRWLDRVLRATFANDLRRLETLTGLDCSDWQRPQP